VFWEINKETTRKLGRFDFTKFDSDPWFGGFSYYDHVFELVGNCNDTGEEQPTGTPFSTGNPGDSHEGGVHMVWTSLADDFVVRKDRNLFLQNSKFPHYNLGISSMQQSISVSLKMICQARFFIHLKMLGRPLRISMGITRLQDFRWTLWLQMWNLIGINLLSYCREGIL
jgi:hypothetical protein